MPVIMNIQGDFEMTFKHIGGEDVSPELEEMIVASLQNKDPKGIIFYATMARRRIVMYNADGNSVDMYEFDLEPTDNAQYEYELFNDL